LASLSRFVRPGGIIAFQEVAHVPVLLLSGHLTTWSAALSVVVETLKRSGANPEIGLALSRLFQEAGVPAPTMRMEVLFGSDSDFTRWLYDLLFALRPQIQQTSLDTLGDFDTLGDRLQAEVASSKSGAPNVAVVSAWSRKPPT
jgi:hypothetical protein